MGWCEEDVYRLQGIPPRLTTFPCQYWNAYSAFAYIFSGMLVVLCVFPDSFQPVFYMTKPRTKQWLNLMHPKELRIYAGACFVAVGIGSFLGHACSQTILGQRYTHRGEQWPGRGVVSSASIDQLFMFFSFYFSAFIAMLRLGLRYWGNVAWLGPSHRKYMYAWFFVVHPCLCVGLHFLATFWPLPNSFNHAMYMAATFFCLLADICIHWLPTRVWSPKISVEGMQRNRYYAKMAWAVLWTSFIIWIGDGSGLLCDYTHLGHAYWHLAGSISFYYSFQSWAVEEYVSVSEHAEVSERLKQDMREADKLMVQFHSAMGKQQLQQPRPLSFWFYNRKYTVAFVVFLSSVALGWTYMTIAVTNLGYELIKQAQTAGFASLFGDPWLMDEPEWKNGARDQSDSTWEFFRTNLPIIGFAAFLFAFCSFSLSICVRGKNSLHVRQGWYFVSGIVLLSHVLGYLVTTLLFLYGVVNYISIKAFLKHRHSPFLVLVGSLCLLGAAYCILVSELFSPYRSAFLGSDRVSLVVSCNALIFMFLRLVSFNADYAGVLFNKNTNLTHLSSHMRTCKSCRDSSSQQLCDQKAQEFPLALTSYTALNYFGFLFYVPLFFGGPVLSFNAFMSYTVNVNRSRRTVLNAICAAIISIIVVELSLHLMFPNVFLHALSSLEPFVLKNNVLGLLWSCQYVWWLQTLLKISAFGLAARAFAILDGVVPPSNLRGVWIWQASLLDGWCYFHHSLYLWLHRYVYMPLGGRHAWLRAAGGSCFIMLIFYAAILPSTKFARQSCVITVLCIFASSWIQRYAAANSTGSSDSTIPQVTQHFLVHVFAQPLLFCFWMLLLSVLSIHHSSVSLGVIEWLVKLVSAHSATEMLGACLAIVMLLTASTQLVYWHLFYSMQGRSSVRGMIFSNHTKKVAV